MDEARYFRATGFRRAVAQPVEAFEIAHPAVPRELEGLRILHVSDLHIRRFAARRGWFERLCEAVGTVEVDVVALTGDLMDRVGQEEATVRMLERLGACWRARVGVFGVFGNHDSPALRRMVRERVGGVRWMDGETVEVDVRGAVLRVVGWSWPEDGLGWAVGGAGGHGPRADNAEKEVAHTSRMELAYSADHAGGLFTALSAPGPWPRSPSFTLTLVHHPTTLIAAAQLGLPLLLAGHTHAGQARVSPRLAPHTSSDIPVDLASGVLRFGDTLMCVSRGVGEGVVEGLRVNCPWQVPLYTLRRGELARAPRGRAGWVTQVVGW